MFTANINVSVSGQLGGSYSTSSIITAGLRKSLFEEIPALSITEVVFDLDVSQTKMIAIRSDKGLVIYTNNQTTPDNTITLVADESFLWPVGNPALKDTAGAVISTDINSLYVENPTTDIATLRMDALVDPTI